MIKFHTYNFPNNITLTSDTLNIYITKFWSDIYQPLIDVNSNRHLLILCKVYYLDSTLGYRTIGKLRSVNFTDMELLHGYLSDRLGILSDSYSDNPISKIIFTYIIKEGLASNQDRSLLQDLTNELINTHRFTNIDLPISMVPSDFGSIISEQVFDDFTRYIVTSNKRTYQIDVYINGTNKCKILGLAKFTWTDIKEADRFRREIGKSTLYFNMEGELILRKQELPVRPFSKMREDKSLKSNFITFDIETIKKVLDNGTSKLVPYLICAYNGSTFVESFGANQMELFKNFIIGLLSFFPKKAKTLSTYAHNLSNFDGIFLMKYLEELGEIKPLIHNGKLISVTLKLNASLGEAYAGKTIIFKDSYLLLPLSLRNLCIAFGVNTVKGYFPFKLFKILYTGVFPQFEYWTGISMHKWSDLKNVHGKRMWSFKDESINYCRADCQALHEVLTAFNELIFKEYKINIHSVLTLPSLAMKIFNVHFMIPNTIYRLRGRVEQAIRQSYMGGHVDVYKPHNKIGSFFGKFFRELYYYDVNSLYPTVMASTPMPIGKPTYFEGDIRLIDPNVYGFFYCDIVSPEYLEHPLLLRRIKTSGGIRTIAGLGSWSGWICSSEMDNALKYGYKFTIIKGYQFETGDLFTGFITKMYKMRMAFDKSHPMNLISKLLMNSLYGKFGMKVEYTKLLTFTLNIDTSNNGLSIKNDKSSKDLLDFLNNHRSSIHDIIRLDNKVFIVKDIDNNLADDDDYAVEGSNVNIAIASGITAVARVYMSIFKNSSAFTLYYSDTDSIVIDKPLPNDLVGDKLGQLKLEYTIKKAVFLAPKVYGLVTSDNKEVIKIKGITSDVASSFKFNVLSCLLYEDSTRVVTQQKWFKSFVDGSITISDMIYTLRVTSNKRRAVFIKGVFEKTQPYNYDDISSNNK